MARKKSTIGFIGAGRAGSVLAIVLARRGYQITAVSDVDAAAVGRLARRTGAAIAAPEEVAERAAIVFITTPDDVIGQVAGEIAQRKGWREGHIALHVSGALPSTVLKPARAEGALAASMHPLLSFPTAETSPYCLTGTSFAVEGDEQALLVAASLVRDIGGYPVQIASGDKMLYHAAATISSNYLVTLVYLSGRLFAALGMTQDEAIRALLPLLNSTISSIEDPGLPECLTGPISRGDVGTVAGHLRALSVYSPEIADLYCHLGLHTIPIALEKGSLDAGKAIDIGRVLQSFRGRTREEESE